MGKVIRKRIFEKNIKVGENLFCLLYDGDNK